MKIPFDCHSHSTQSPDGEGSPREMIERAIELGLRHYTLTDHVEINHFDEDFPYAEKIKESSRLIPALKEEYSDRIALHYGVELGQGVHNEPLSLGIVKDNPYDFILGSCHMVRGREDFYDLDYTKLDINPLLFEYFDEQTEMAEKGGFDVMGHITYPLRYLVGNYNIRPDMSVFKDAIDTLLRTLIKNERGIEINTAGLFKEIAELCPNEEIIARYYELGGRILTVGSDAHRTADLGRGVEEGIKAAKNAGFKELCVFEKRQPLFIKI